MQLNGSSANAQSGREAILRPGDASLCDTARPWTLAFEKHARFLVCRLPGPQMRERVDEIEDLSGIHLNGSAGGLAVLSNFLQSLLLQADRTQDAGWLENMDAIVMDLVAASCRVSARGNATIKAPSPRLESVLSFIAENLGEARLDVNMVADHFGLGARSIQKLFAAHGTTMSAHVSRRRLNYASLRLAEPGNCSITEIALDAGFSDLTYFGRAFRNAFGRSPREYRQDLRRPDSKH